MSLENYDGEDPTLEEVTADLDKVNQQVIELHAKYVELKAENEKYEELCRKYMEENAKLKERIARLETMQTPNLDAYRGMQAQTPEAIAERFSKPDMQQSPYVGEIFIPLPPPPFRLDWERLAVWLGILAFSIAAWVGIVYGIIWLWRAL